MGVQLVPLEEYMEGEIEYEGDGTLLIARVIPGSPAEKAGLKDGDILLGVRNREVGSFELLLEILADTVVGEEFPVRVWRAGETLDVTLVLGPRPAEFAEEHEEGEDHESSEHDRERMKLEAAHQEVTRALKRAEDEVQVLQSKLLEAAEAGKLEQVRDLVGRIREMTSRITRLHVQRERLAAKLEAAKAAPEIHPEILAARRELEILRLAMKAFLEKEKADAADRIEHAIHARELRLEGERGEDAQKVYRSEPKRGEVGELLVWASKIWAEFGHEEKEQSREDRIRQLEGRIQELTGALKRLMQEIDELRDEK